VRWLIAACDRVDRQFDQLREYFREMRRELAGQFVEVRAEISTSGRQLTTIGWALVGILLVQLITALAVH
jgi:CHASE3 domain sensor protein